MASPKGSAVPAESVRDLSPVTYKWLRLFARAGFLEPVKWATEVGIKAPEAGAERMMLRCSKLITKMKLERWVAEGMGIEECRRYLSEIGRGNVAATPQQVKALEMIARFHGLLSDKVDVNLDQSHIESAVLQVLTGVQRAPRELPSNTG